MAVTLVIEDGSGIETANTWVTLEETRAYAEARGITLAADDDAVGAQIVLAADYLNSFGDRYKGVQTHRGYPMAWPRFGAYLQSIDREVFPDDQIPPELKRAQNEAVIAIHEGVDLMPNVPGGVLPVKRRRVGPIEREFFGPGELAGYNWRKATIPAVDAIIGPLLAVGFGLRTVRA